MRRHALLCLLLPLLALAACDANDPDPAASPRDVEGVYDLTTLRFTPTAAGVQPANPRARLDSTETRLQFFGDGNVLFYYRLVQGPNAPLSGFIPGTFTVTSTAATVTLQPTSTTILPQLLLPQTVPFTRSEAGLLVFTQQTSLNLEAYDAETYAGLTGVGGQLRVELAPRD